MREILGIAAIIYIFIKYPLVLRDLFILIFKILPLTKGDNEETSMYKDKTKRLSILKGRIFIYLVALIGLPLLIFYLGFNYIAIVIVVIALPFTLFTFGSVDIEKQYDKIFKDFIIQE